MSGGRGRLIFPKIVEIARYDPAATKATGGFDRPIREIKITNANDGSPRVRPREERLVRLQGQIETSTFQSLAQGPFGNAPGGSMRVVCYGPELEAAGLVEAETQRSLLKVTDRLAAIYELDGTTLIFRLPTTVEGSYWQATQVQPCGFGFGFGGANLLELTFEARPQGVGSASG
jgi:hypothetical protein